MPSQLAGNDWAMTVVDSGFIHAQLLGLGSFYYFFLMRQLLFRVGPILAQIPFIFKDNDSWPRGPPAMEKSHCTPGALERLDNFCRRPQQRVIRTMELLLAAVIASHLQEFSGFESRRQFTQIHRSVAYLVFFAMLSG